MFAVARRDGAERALWPNWYEGNPLPWVDSTRLEHDDLAWSMPVAVKRGSGMGRSVRNACAVFVSAALGMAGLSGCSRTGETRSRKTLTVSGTVLERVEGAPYTYLRIKTDSGEVWAMVPSASVRSNERVTVIEGVLLKDFDTGLPGRRFDVIMGSLEQER